MFKIFIFSLAIFFFRCNFLVNISDKDLPSKIVLYKKGFNFVSWKRTEFSEQYSKASLDSMLVSGANWVSIVVTLYQNDEKDTLIFEDVRKTPSVYSIMQIVEYARSKGIGTMLKIHIDLKNGALRSQIKPSDVSAWFRNYSKFVLNYANLCSMLGVDMLCIGTELPNISSYKNEWLELINSVRKIYDGAIIYASNFDEFKSVSFWDAVDFIGIDFFAPVSNKPDPTYDELVLGWQPYLNDLKNWFYENHNSKKLIFTEVGYPSVDGCSMKPWANHDGEVDLEEQALCFRVALDIITHIDFVDGVFIWNWLADLSADSLKKDFTPYGKPAFEVIKNGWAEKMLASESF